MNDKRIFEDAFGEFKSNNRMTLAAYNHTIKALEKKEQLEQANKGLLEINQQLGAAKQELEKEIEQLKTEQANYLWELDVRNSLMNRNQELEHEIEKLRKEVFKNDNRN